MSDMFDPDDMPDDPFEPHLDDAMRAEADMLMQRWQEYEDKARTLGLYLEGHPQIAILPTPMGPKMVLQVTFQIGRVAFTDRVQFPEKNAVDDEARKMEVGLKDDLFLDERARIEQGLAEGKSLDEIMLGDDDDLAP